VTRLVWSPRSIRDLESIRDYIAQDSPLYAALVIERLVQAPEQLLRFPELGRVVPEREDPDLRELIIRPFRLGYRPLPDTIEIVTVFRATRLLPE
jgi:addiction module RelE/StbE family toxin